MYRAVRSLSASSLSSIALPKFPIFASPSPVRRASPARPAASAKIQENLASRSSPVLSADAMPDPKLATDSRWRSLGTPEQELRLDFTLPTGQSFRWRRTSPGTYVGVVGQLVVAMKQGPTDVQYRILARGPAAQPAEDAAALGDYFNLSTSLAELAAGWRAADERFARLSAALPGARMLRQDPFETLMSFICSQNNHISRIHGMVNRLCQLYGMPLPVPEAAALPGEEDLEPSSEPDQGWFAFPTLHQLAAATEEELRDAGFGYRAKYIVGSVAALQEKPGGGEAWLLSLRSVPFQQAVEALCTLPGVGPKVAACVCLFSMDKHDAIPVDTHVWQLAVRHYTPHLRGKTLNPKLHGQVQAAFVERFGPFAGWAHNTLFIAELASMKEHLAAAGKRAASESEDSSASDSASDWEAEEAPAVPTPPLDGKRMRRRPRV